MRPDDMQKKGELRCAGEQPREEEQHPASHGPIVASTGRTAQRPAKNPPGTGRRREERVKGGDSPSLGRGHAETLADVVQRTFTDPAHARLDGLQCGQEQWAPFTLGPAAVR